MPELLPWRVEIQPERTLRSLSFTNGRTKLAGLTRCLSEGLDVAFINLEHHRSHDQIDGEDQAKAFFAPDHDSFRIHERPALDSDSLALAKVGMRLWQQTCGQTRCQRADLGFWNCGGLALKGHEAQHTGSSKNTQTIASVEIHEDIAREQGHVQFLTAIPPATNAAVQRKKAVQSTVLEMTGNQLLVPRTNRHGIPSLDRQRLFPVNQSFLRNTAPRPAVFRDSVLKHRFYSSPPPP